MPDSLATMLTSINDGGANTAAEMRAVITALFNWIPATERYKVGRQAGETAHASDDFFTSLAGYTELDITGATTWTADRSGLSCIYSGQSANDFGVLLKAVPGAGVPTTIETHAFDLVKRVANPMWGIIFTDGVIATSNLAGFGKAASTSFSDFYQFSGTLTSVTATILTANEPPYGEMNDLYMRLTWISANTFGWSVSPDSVNWTDFGQADLSTTFTPTHMGFFVSAWGASGDMAVTFNYLRVYDADLSV